MGLREKMAEQAAQLASQRQIEEQSRQEEQLKPIRNQLATLEEKKKALETTLANFGSAETDSAAALVEFKKTKTPIDKIYEEFKDVAGESKTEFIRANEEEPEIKAYRASGHALRQSVKQLHEIRTSGQTQVSAENQPSSVKGVERKKSGARTAEKQAIEAEILATAQKIAELKLQTPEGQQEHEEGSGQSHSLEWIYFIGAIWISRPRAAEQLDSL